MLNSKPDLPRFVRVMNSLGSGLGLDKLKFARIDEEVLTHEAVKQTGLTDFGDIRYQEGLHRFLNSVEKDANLNFLGRLLVHNMTFRTLANRLKMTEFFKQQPNVPDQPLIPPIIILGFFRTGTTLLHRMLTEDHAHCGIPLWRMIHPFSYSEKLYKKVEKNLRTRLKIQPKLDSIHYVRADTPEECISLQIATFESFLFWVLEPVYDYLDWYRSRDCLDSYREYRSLLRYFQAENPSQRLTLKSPAHMGVLPTLLKVIPGALIIHTHRDPVPACNSFNSMIHCFHSMVSDNLDVGRTARKNMEAMAGWIAPCMAARSANPDRIYDVYYNDLIADPVGTVKAVYDHFRLDWPDGYEKRLQAYIRKNPKDKYGKHSYKSEDFGITDKMITSQFAEYIETFGFNKGNYAN
ncbi:MAG: sulfotransferase [Desulfobacteraceae bacterium]|nr:sulfotransferase [Desulfobacteraceae bacterium]